MLLVEALYGQDDAQATMQNFIPLDYGERKEIAPGIELCLSDAGHILGSAIVELWLSEGALERKLVFSGDLGHRGTPILRDPAYIKEADLVVLESTYGDRLHRTWEATWEEMKEIFTQHGGKGNFLIPAFTIGRTQELLYTFRRFYDEWNLGAWHIFLDSPMAIEATEVYTQYVDIFDKDAVKERQAKGSLFDLPNLHVTKTADESMGINQIVSGAIIIAGSGMCDGGRIKHHIKHNIWRDDCEVLMVGFQARGTLGRKLVDGAKNISLWGESMRVAAKIHTIGGLSAHADRDGLIDWYKHFDGNPAIALVHGEEDIINAFSNYIQGHLQAKIIAPEPGMKLNLATL
jgi:metallo-beta-lactamase family protein